MTRLGVFASAESIAADLREASEAADREANRSHKRKSKPAVVAPFERPNWRLRCQIYSLACAIGEDINRRVNLFEKMRDRDDSFAYRFRKRSAVDLAIRLVNAPPENTTLGVKDHNAKPLLSKSHAHRIRTELNFAYLHSIHETLLMPFILSVGGYEIISARVAENGYPLDEFKSLWKLRNNRHPLTLHKMRLEREIELDNEYLDKLTPTKISNTVATDDDGWPDELE